MGTQGLVTVQKDGKVVMKLITGQDGYFAEKVANQILKEWPVTGFKAYKIAQNIGFRCIDCLVVITEKQIITRGDEEVNPLYRETFHDPEFNPRWAQGTADHTVVINV
jgi:hypothetical protein